MPNYRIVLLFFYIFLSIVFCFVFTLCIQIVTCAYIAGSHGWSVAINDEHLKSVIMHGNRPPLDAITGPADLVSFVTECIAMCWHESPDERPPFDCMYCQHDE